MSGTAVVYFYKIESPLIEKQIGILSLVTIKTYSDTILVGIPDRATSIASRFRINSSLQTFGVNIISYYFHSVRETLGVCMQQSLFVTPAKKAIVYIDKLIPGFAQSFLDHCICLFFYQVFIDIYPVCVP